MRICSIGTATGKKSPSTQICSTSTPNTLTLLAYGGGLLEDLLGVVEAPRDNHDAGVVVRCSLDGAWSTSGYFRVSDRSIIPSLDKLLPALDDLSDVSLTADSRNAIEKQFLVAVEQRLVQDNKARTGRRNAHLSSLREEIRQFLVEAAYIELALASHRDLFDEALPLDFSDAAFQRLKRHKVPLPGP